MGDLERFWADMLSGDRQKIVAAFGPLPMAERRAVIRHLRRMANGEGWSPGQRNSARIALKGLADQSQALDAAPAEGQLR